VKKPNTLNSADLTVLIGHAPVDKKGFLIDKPELINIEEVKILNWKDITIILKK
jgi:hypothetical protein